MIVKLLTQHHLEFLSLKGGCRDSSESTLDKMSNCWKFRAAAQLCLLSDNRHIPLQKEIKLERSQIADIGTSIFYCKV